MRIKLLVTELITQWIFRYVTQFQETWYWVKNSILMDLWVSRCQNSPLKRLNIASVEDKRIGFIYRYKAFP